MCRYQQAHLPLLEQKSIKGHSVRAMYLLTALADLQRIETTSLDPGYLSALKCLWTDMVERKMYLTGGVGAMEQWEGFGQDYFLPHGSDEGGCYAETCAAIGVVMFAERLAQVCASSLPIFMQRTDASVARTRCQICRCSGAGTVQRSPNRSCLQWTRIYIRESARIHRPESIAT